MRRAFIRPSASIDELVIHLIPSFPSSTSPRTWWCIMSICLVRFWLSGSFVKVRLVLLSPSISILLTTCSGRSSFRKHLIHTPCLAPWLIATYLASDVDVDTVCCRLLDQVVIAPPRKKQYPVIGFLSSRSPV